MCSDDEDEDEDGNYEVESIAGPIVSDDEPNLDRDETHSTTDRCDTITLVVSDDDTYYEDRTKLIHTVNRRRGQNHQATSVTEKYIQHVIITAKKLGAGYFGTVYLGIDTKLNQQFAIKTMNLDIFLTNGASSSLENIQ